ncbi:hypothetical protein CYY_002129 [Polysphondylium violaceum]|uniref:Uncharacterized protein n=1 Tax=Polysphondylium violaceum TaxID=133409 RepID=A0A8J4PXA4_9MYCE|nr:hypothetical protein CYY_002129 [Polysphondylium violaceum]
MDVDMDSDLDWSSDEEYKVEEEEDYEEWSDEELEEDDESEEDEEDLQNGDQDFTPLHSRYEIFFKDEFKHENEILNEYILSLNGDQEDDHEEEQLPVDDYQDKNIHNLPYHIYNQKEAQEDVSDIAEVIQQNQVVQLIKILESDPYVQLPINLIVGPILDGHTNILRVLFHYRSFEGLVNEIDFSGLMEVVLEKQDPILFKLFVKNLCSSLFTKLLNRYTKRLSQLNIQL